MQTLFDTATARRTDPVTSFIAADYMNESGKLKKHHKFILELLKRFDREQGWTPGELAHKAKKIMQVDEQETYYLISRRINELERSGKIYEVMIRQCLRRGTAQRAWRIL
ncbi:MAG: hypothetical protein ACFFBD_09245 [Candidatus Hodarchaeota archaeon]